MSYKQKAWFFGVTGNTIFMICLVSIVVSVLKGFYFHFDGVPILKDLSIIIKSIVYDLKEVTSPFLGFFWKNSPTPSMSELNSSSNKWFAFTYVLLFFGAFLVRYARNIFKILKEVDRERFKNKLRGKPINDFESNEISVIVKDSFHSSYVAPLIVGLLIPVVIYIFKIIFVL